MVPPLVEVLEGLANGHELNSRGKSMIASESIDSSLSELMMQLEELWSNCDEVFANIRTLKWEEKFGQHWTYADIPRHLAYVDRSVVADGIMFGAEMPTEKRLFMHSHRQFNEWNDRMLTQYRRPNSVQFALDQMQKSRGAIRDAVANLTDEDLVLPVWFPLTGLAGWRTVKFALEFCRHHTWVHFTQLCLRLQIAPSNISPRIIHGALDSLIYSLSPLLNESIAQKVSLATRLVVTGLGGGCWEIKVFDGKCIIAKAADISPRVNMILTLTPETLVEILSNMRYPIFAFLTGHLQVRGLRYLPVFLQLFPRPDPDRQLVPFI